MRTLEGQDNVPGQTYTVTKDKVECYNSKNPEKPEHPYRWVDANVTCRDWKIRYGRTLSRVPVFRCTYVLGPYMPAHWDAHKS